MSSQDADDDDDDFDSGGNNRTLTVTGMVKRDVNVCTNCSKYVSCSNKKAP